MSAAVTGGPFEEDVRRAGASSELNAAVRDMRNLAALLNVYGGGDGSPHVDPMAYRMVSEALYEAQLRALRAARDLTGSVDARPSRKLSLEQRRARVASVYAEGMRAAFKSLSQDCDAHAVERMASAFALGQVTK